MRNALVTQHIDDDQHTDSSVSELPPLFVGAEGLEPPTLSV